MISELIPREELDREANPEELRLFGRFFERTANQDTEISSCQSREKSPEQEAKEKARKILESINNTYGGQSNA